MSFAPQHPLTKASEDPILSDPTANTTQALNAVTAAASKTGQSAVEIAGFLEDLGRNAKSEQELLNRIEGGLSRVLDETEHLDTSSQTVLSSAKQTRETVSGSVARMKASGERAHRIADWVSGVRGWMTEFRASLAATERDLTQITEISREVKILALNARIEAARAGAAGAGFAVIAGAIGQLARDTTDAADGISESLTQVRKEATNFAAGAAGIMGDAEQLISESTDVDVVLAEIQQGMTQLDQIAGSIADATGRVRDAVGAYVPDIRHLETSVRQRGQDIVRLCGMSIDLIDMSEEMVQHTIGLGGSSRDQILIDRVRADAEHLSQRLEAAIARGDITEADLFSSDYRPIAGSNPQQVLAPFTQLTDKLFPEVQEAALALSDRIVFCAAVDRNGYLPTHNRKFSQPQGADPVWNASNCRNRRIFADRVGLKAGQNTAPFLLQVYRRDMGGGEFKIMMDVSAPIIVRGRHWGGLRLAFR